LLQASGHELEAGNMPFEQYKDQIKPQILEPLNMQEKYYFYQGESSEHNYTLPSYFLSIK
jgi:hypothetical protein